MHLQPEDFLNPTIEQFNNNTNLEIKIQGWVRFGCDAVAGYFRTSAESITMDCKTVDNVSNAVIFSLPVSGESGFDSEKLQLFLRNSTELVEKSITIECIMERALVCQDNFPFFVTFFYNTVMASDNNGTRTVRKQNHQLVEGKEVFTASIHVQAVHVIESDSFGRLTHKPPLLSIEKRPKIIN